MKKSNYIKDLIYSKNMTISSIAKKMGIHQSSLSLKINGSRNFKDKEIPEFLRILNMKYEEVFGKNETIIVDNDKSIVNINNNEYIVSQSIANTIEELIKKEVG